MTGPAGEAAVARRWSGWIFHNPDTGIELSENHPVRSGECEDAKDIRPATREALRDELLSAWRGLAEQEADHAEMFREGAATRDRLAAELAAARAEVEAKVAAARDAALEEAARIAGRHWDGMVVPEARGSSEVAALIRAARTSGGTRHDR